MSKGGKLIIVLFFIVKNEIVLCIVFYIIEGLGVVIFCGNVYYIVIEYGIVLLCGKSICEWVLELIWVVYFKFCVKLLVEVC